MSIRRIVAGVMAFSVMCTAAVSCGDGGDSSSKSKKSAVTSSESEIPDQTQAETQAQTQAQTAAAPKQVDEVNTTTKSATTTELVTETIETTTEPVTEPPILEDSFETNSYCDILDKAVICMGDQYNLIIKVLGNKTGAISVNLRDSLGASEDYENCSVTQIGSVYLTKGEVNYIRYCYYDVDITDAKFQLTIEPDEYNSYANLIAGTSAVELVSWEKGDEYLQLTLKQVGKINPSSYPQFRLIYYKDGKIVSVTEGSIPKSFDGPDKTATANAYMPAEFDDVEFIYQPCP